MLLSNLFHSFMKVFANVRAVNEARLVSVAASVGVHISPRTRLTVWDGNRHFDVDYQNDLSSISGQVGNESVV